MDQREILKIVWRFKLTKKELNWSETDWIFFGSQPLDNDYIFKISYFYLKFIWLLIYK